MRDLSQPTVPSRAFYDQLAVETEKRRQANPTATALDPHGGASTQLREELKAHIDAKGGGAWARVAVEEVYSR